MSTIVETLQSIVKNGGHQQLVGFLKSCDESRAFSTAVDETKAVIALTNRLLNENPNRRDGLLVLKCLLGQVPSDLMQANIFPWLQQAVKGLSQKESSSTVTIAADVINILLPLTSEFAEIRKQVALTTVSKILEVLNDLKDSPEFVYVILPCLQVVSKHYNKSASSWKEKFDKFTLSLIEEDDATVQLAARCYLTLAACGPPGMDMTNYKENWTLQFRSLSSALHLVLDRLFDNVNEIEQFSCGTRRYKPNFVVPPVESKWPYLRLNRLTLQFVNISEYMKVFLLGPFPVGKRVVPEQLLSVVCRGLAVTIHTLQAQTTSDTLSLTTLIPQVHTACLSLLRSLIVSCRINLLTYAPVICKLISQVLKSTEVPRSHYGQHKPYRHVRAAAYNCLSSWLTVASCSSGVDKHPELIDYILTDIQFKKSSVTLSLSSKMLRGKMGKKQRQALVNQTISNKDEYVADREANSEVCLAALNVIPPLLESASIFLSPQNNKDLQTAVSTELLLTQLNTGEHVPLPYNNKSCRLALYKSFVAMCHNFHPSFPPPLSFASQLISGGLCDSFDEIVRFCTLSLSSVDKMLRPVGPTLSFPMELPEVIFKPRKSADISDRADLNESVGSLDRSLLATFNGSVSLEMNGTGEEEEPSAPEQDVNPLLVDPEMSDFEYANLPKTPSKQTSFENNERLSIMNGDRHNGPPADEVVALATTGCGTPVSDKVESGTKQNGVSSRLTEEQSVDNSPKRKPQATVEPPQPVPKKLKLDAVEELPVVAAPDSNTPNTVTRDSLDYAAPSDVSTAPAGNDVTAESSLTPDDEMEEAMLSSFVDEVN